MSSSVSPPPPRLISDERWALVEPLIPPREPAIQGSTGHPRPHRPVPGLRPGRSRGHRVRALYRHRLDQAPERAGLRVGLDLLAADARVAEAGVFDRLHTAVLDRLGEQGQLDWSRASLDSVSVRAKRGVS